MESDRFRYLRCHATGARCAWNDPARRYARSPVSQLGSYGRLSRNGYFRQHFFYLRTGLFHPGRKAEVCPQFVDRFVLGEAWRIGSHFKQHAARFPEINRMKISSIHNRADLVTETDQFFSQGNLLFIVRYAESDVMNRPNRDPARTYVRR